MLKQGEVVSLRKAYGETLVELGEKNKNIVVVDADLSSSTMTSMFGKVYPDRFFNCGIAEQDAICTAAGLSTCGKTAFISTFAMFATGRTYDQIRNTVAYSKLNVKIVATHGGITVGEDGASHQALEDVALMRGLPNMTVIVPSDSVEVKAAIRYASEHDGPFYIRLSRTSLANLTDEDKYINTLPKAEVIKEGKDVTVITNGETLIECINAAKILKEKGIDAEVINSPFVKPFDKETFLTSAKKTNLVVSVENHSILNALGSVVCETLCENYPAKVLRIGTNDVFGQSGEQRTLVKYYGLDSEGIAQKIEKFIKNN